MTMGRDWKAIAAVAENGVIGRGLEIPWHIPEDFKHFKAVTMGGIVVMGRRTWEGFRGRPLPGRENAVLSGACPPAEGVRVFRSLGEVREAYAADPRQVWIIGGAGLYREALPFCSEALISRVKMRPEGDVFFPDISADFELAGTLFESEKFDVLKYVRKR